MRIISVVGARPQFIKAAPVSRVLRERHTELLVHTGQHYDYEMSDVFFEQLDLPEPDRNLEVGSGSHGKQTAEMLVALEELFIETAPDAVLVYGDTNTTLAGALAAVKLQVPVVHVEAGLRSFNRTMPEEINRVAVDHVSRMLFCPTPTAVANLAAEGIVEGVEMVGDVMADAVRIVTESLDIDAALGALALARGGYFYATLHRAGNSDDRERLSAAIRAFGRLDAPVVWPLHPRTAANIECFGLGDELAASDAIRVLKPVSYEESIAMIAGARALLTDSGGMQKEAYLFGTPCVTLREDTEWVETLEAGWNVLVGADEDRIVAAATGAKRPADHPDLYGDGHAAEQVVAAIDDRLSHGQ